MSPDGTDKLAPADAPMAAAAETCRRIMADAAARAKHEAPAALMVARPAPRPLGHGEDIRHAFPGADASDNRAGRAGRANGQAVVRVVAVPSPLMPPWRWPAPDA